MSNDAPVLQLTLDGEALPVELANNDIPGQTDKARGKRHFFSYLAATFPNLEDVYQLMARGYNWDKAVYITWLATPRPQRRPATLSELAGLLNLKSERVFSTWRQRGVPIREEAAKLALSRATEPGPERLEAVVEALYETAAQRGREGTGDRKLVLQMLGLLNERPKEADKNADPDETFLRALETAYDSAIAA